MKVDVNIIKLPNIELCKQENEKDVLKRVYRAVKVIDRAKAQIIKEHKFN